MTIGIESILEAARLLDGVTERTPCAHSRTLSEITGAKVYIKLENLQFTASFKERGAFIKLRSLSAEERTRGVIAMSAGNHAQGVAYHAQALAIPATIVMPVGTPTVKVQQTEGHGADVVQHGATLSESFDFAAGLAAERGLTFVHPYDDPLIIAGQGTVAVEMLQDVPDLDVLVVPVGGGGLISGCAIAAKALRPACEVIGVETDLYPSMRQVINGEEIRCGGQTIAEGIAVKAPGKLTRAIVAEHVDDILLVAETDIERAIDLYVGIEKTVAEGAGAASLAAVLAHPGRFRGRRTGLVLSGGNIDTRLLASILMRGLIRDGRITRMRVEIADRPGVLAAIAGIIGACQGNILEVQHQRMFPDVPASLAEVDVVVETRDRAHLSAIEAALQARGYVVRQLLATSDSD